MIWRQSPGPCVVCGSAHSVCPAGDGAIIVIEQLASPVAVVVHVGTPPIAQPEAPVSPDTVKPARSTPGTSTPIRRSSKTAPR
jgi:hypothetical protein